jgi:hypothetical protein
MEKGAFDCVLGNPPWEVSQLNDIEFFGAFRPEISRLAGAARKAAIAALEQEDPAAWHEFSIAKRGFDCSNEFFRAGGFPLCAEGEGEYLPAIC